MAKQPAWTADEIDDLRTIAADTTLTWAEVAAAIAARDPSRPRRTPLALRMAALRYGIPHRTDDTGRQVRVSVPGRPADKAPTPDPIAAGKRAASRIPTEGEVQRALTIWTQMREACAAGEGWGDGYVEGLVRGRAEVLDALRALLDVYDRKEKNP